MWEEEPPVDVMRIGVGVAVLVMHSVVSGPHVDGRLHWDAVAQHEKDPQREASLVGSVRP